MESKDPGGKEPAKNSPIKNFCWPLKGKEKEECIQSYEDIFEEEEDREKSRMRRWVKLKTKRPQEAVNPF